jgi:hypothetical protein
MGWGARQSVAAVVLGALLLGLALPRPATAQAPSLEYPIKAAFLAKFGDFVSWPSDAFPAGAPLSICVIGTDPFGTSLDEAVRGQQVRERAIEVRRLSRADAVETCHILYLGPAAPGVTQELMRAIDGRPILTVSDDRNGPAAAVIHFVIQQNRVRFAINDAMAANRGLGISSKLLSLAVNVTPRPRSAAP